MPDNWDACLIPLERKATNVKDKLRQPPIPKPRNADHTVARKPPHTNIPPKPRNVIATMNNITKYCLSVRSKRTGTIKLAGIVNTSINESINHALEGASQDNTTK